MGFTIVRETLNFQLTVGFKLSWLVSFPCVPLGTSDLNYMSRNQATPLSTCKIYEATLEPSSGRNRGPLDNVKYPSAPFGFHCSALEDPITQFGKHRYRAFRPFFLCMYVCILTYALIDTIHNFYTT